MYLNSGASGFAQTGLYTAASGSVALAGDPAISLAGWDLIGLSDMWKTIETAVMALWNNQLVQKAVSLVKGIFGKRWLAILGALAVGGIIAKWLYDWFKRGRNKHRRRLSIGSNPRIGTLIKVAKRTDTLTKKFGSRMRHAGLIHSQTRHNYSRWGNGRKDLTIVR